MARRTCPACSKRYAQLVTPDCPVCEGVGVLGLHPVALAPVGLKPTDPAVVSRAVELYLEAAAAHAADTIPPGDGRGRRQALAAAAERLRTARIVGPPLGLPERDGHWTPEYPDEKVTTDKDAAKVAALHGQHPTPADGARVDAAPRIPDPDARPRAMGQLPDTSMEGYPSHLVQAADPIDPLGPDNQVLAFQRQNRDRRAQVIAQAVDPIVDMRTKAQG